MEKTQRLIKRVANGASGWERAMETLFEKMTEEQQQKFQDAVPEEIKGYMAAVPDPSPEQVKGYHRFLFALHARECFPAVERAEKQKNALLKRLF